MKLQQLKLDIFFLKIRKVKKVQLSQKLLWAFMSSVLFFRLSVSCLVSHETCKNLSHVNADFCFFAVRIMNSSFFSLNSFAGIQITLSYF